MVIVKGSVHQKGLNERLSITHYQSGPACHPSCVPGTCFTIPGKDDKCLKVFLNEQVHCKGSIKSKKERWEMVVKSKSSASCEQAGDFVAAPEIPPLSLKIISTADGTPSEG